MIKHITGEIIEKDEGNIIVEVEGIGYAIGVSKRLQGAKGADISLWTHMAVREHSMELFGFIQKEELSLFEMLINVSGIGPRSALSIMDLAPAGTLYAAILNGDTEYLTKVSGIGKKTAEKIVFELRDKIDEGMIDVKDLPNNDADVLEALVSLGYTRDSARKAVKAIDTDSDKLHDRLAEALKVIK